jgi:hypothetical protein
MNETNSSKESKSIATRISHKIQKTLGVSNKDISIEDKPVNRLIRSTKMIDLFAAEEIPYVHKVDREESEKDDESKEDDKSKEDVDSKEDDKSKEDDCQEICFREVKIVNITGCVGPTGPPGPLLPFSNTFICLNRETEQILSKEDPIIWTSNQIKVGDINNDVNTSGIFIWRPGYYIVYYNLYHQQPCQFSLFKNGVVINGSTINSSTGSSQNSSFLIVRIDSADFICDEPLSPTGRAVKIEVINHTSTVSNIQLVVLNGKPQVVATISVVLLFETSP